MTNAFFNVKTLNFAFTGDVLSEKEGVCPQTIFFIQHSIDVLLEAEGEQIAFPVDKETRLISFLGADFDLHFCPGWVGESVSLYEFVEGKG